MIFSFDYELAWGTFEMVHQSYVRRNILGASRAAASIAALHEQLGVPVTWAVVGAAIEREPLMETVARGRRANPRLQDILPYLAGLSADEVTRATRIPEEFLARVNTHNVHEFASHTYSHPFADAATAEEWETDFALFHDAATRRGMTVPVSVVAPKNLLTPAFLNAARRHGLTQIRQNSQNWLYRFRSRASRIGLLIRVLRVLDAFLPLNELAYVIAGPPKCVDGAYLEGNFFFRPSWHWRVGDYLHFARFKLWVWFAHRTGRDIHVWSHPHNFGADINRSLRNYERLLRHLVTWCAARGVPFSTMRDAS